MPHPPKVSIITAAYNAEPYIGACMNSVLAQTYSNWDMWVVDDASTDRTKDIVQSYAQKYPNIHYVGLKENSGGAAIPRNVALEKTDASLVAFLDSDDMFMPTKLSEQIAFMQDKNASLSYTGYRRVTPGGDHTGRLIHVPEEMTYRKYLGNTCICLSSSMVDREKVGDVKFTAGYLGREDFILWLDVMRDGKKGFGLNKDLTRYRRGHASLSSNVTKSACRSWDVYQEFAKDLNIFERVAAYGSYALHAMEKRLRF